ncbi:MAG: PIN domain-containing protein [Acidimicrobiia bacterium]|nr:PIN domain-containing protein [Acidimicrobiia bacterium]
MAFVAMYDASVLHPGSLRDLLVRLGQSGLFQAKWTEVALQEAFATIIDEQPELEQRLEQTRQLMADSIPDATVRGYEPLIPSLELSTTYYRHVLAAAIACNAQVIVTSNPRSFPDEEIARYNIEAQTPDEFVVNVFELAPARVVGIVQDQAAALTNHETGFDDLLDRLRAVGLPRPIAAIRQSLGLGG